MRKIAVIGSGQTGLLAAHGLVLAGFEVSLFTDRSADAWLHDSAPTGTAARFADSLAYERELGLDQWHDVAPAVDSIYLHFCPDLGNQLLTMVSRFDRPAMAIDLRLQSHRWMNELEARGGTTEIVEVDIAKLEDISAAHDLTLVASGRGELSTLFRRNPERSVYDSPQRHLCMICFHGVDMDFEGLSGPAVKFNFIGTAGESFWVPYYHKDLGVSWNGIVEARPGSVLDRFAEVGSADQALATIKELFREHWPWNYEWFRHAKVSDPRGWLKGAFAPTVRDPVGELPSGRLVYAIGDACMALDPIAGQGANNGNRMVKNLVASAVAHGDAAFDATWMRETFEAFYEDSGRVTYEFNNILLEPLTAAGKLLLTSQYGSDGRARGSSGAQRLADAIADNFTDPRRYTDAFRDVGEAFKLVKRETGAPMLALARAGAAIAKNQLRQKLGRPPQHPPHSA